MPYMIFDSRLACCVSLLQTRFQISIAWNRNPGPSSTTTTTRTAQTKKICWYLDNNCGNYLGDNNSRSSASDSCRGYLTPMWLSYLYDYVVSANSCRLDTKCYRQNCYHHRSIDFYFLFFRSDTCFTLSFLLSLSEDYFDYFCRNEMRQKL